MINRTNIELTNPTEIWAEETARELNPRIRNVVDRVLICAVFNMTEEEFNKMESKK